VLKAVLLDFNGVIIDDEPIHQQLLQELLLGENLRSDGDEFQRYCVGRTDRTCIQDLLASRGRVVTPRRLDELIAMKAAAYQQALQQLDPLPLFAGVRSCIARFRAAGLTLAIVSGALRAEIEYVLSQTGLGESIDVLVGAEDVTSSKPSPEGYERAIASLNRRFPSLQLHPQNCLAIEDTWAGIQAAKQAMVPVVGVAHTYPFHMLQRWSNWAIDGLEQLELPRIEAVFRGEIYPTLEEE
jgi:HAD superfamily hydrolase (TIGR01509 family)